VVVARCRAFAARRKERSAKRANNWTIGYGGKSLRLKDTKGLWYLAHLLRHPRDEFRVLDLAGGIAGQRDDTETSQSDCVGVRGHGLIESCIK
jgi:hypothetical protein